MFDCIDIVVNYDHYIIRSIRVCVRDVSKTYKI